MSEVYSVLNQLFPDHCLFQTRHLHPVLLQLREAEMNTSTKLEESVCELVTPNIKTKERSLPHKIRDSTALAWSKLQENGY